MDALSVLAGKLEVTNGDIVAGRDVDVKGVIKNTAQVWNGVSEWIDQALVISDNVDLTGNLTATGNVGGLNLSASNNLAVSNTAALKDVTMWGTLKNTYVVGGNQPVNIDDNLSVTGKVKATGGFGTYTFRESISKDIAANASGFKYFACNAGEQAISCYGNAFTAPPPEGNFYLNEAFDTYMTGLYPYDGQCEINYKNTSASIRYIKAGALCFNPGT